MSRAQKLLAVVRNNPRGVRFSDLCRLVQSLGFVLDRVQGSHHVYVHPGRPDLAIVNLQEGKNGQAKVYQVEQVLNLVDAHELEVQ
jgi:predicted RNA binding protein YcfA (HicA-like mRNA interferase family)